MQDNVRILYLDDDAGLGVLLSRALTPHGYIVESVETGEEALARLRAARFDVVAMDHNLTNEVGLEIIPQIRALADAPPIIYVTGSEDVRIAVAALKAGAVDYVWKDVQGHYRELLRQAVDTAIEQSRMKRERELAQRQVAEARDRAEAMLTEVNHRVANSLAIVSSFVQMQKAVITDPQARDMLRDTLARIAAIAGVHRRLYTSSDVRTVDVNAYLRSLIEEIGTGFTQAHVTLAFTPAPTDIVIGADKAVSVGVIITELVTNAAKYAYPPGSGGAIRVGVTLLAPQDVEITVEDDGVGWNGKGQVHGSGMGARIIKAMTHSLQTELKYDDRPRGTRASFRIAP